MSIAVRTVVFRADAGLHIGTGHLMRCLTLAGALRAEGTESVFVTRTHAGSMFHAIEAEGYRVVTLPGNTGQPYGSHPAPPAHADWLKANWRLDSAATRAVVEAEQAEWLVVDHYALDAAWEEIARPEGVRLMAIDDLADRPHIADNLLDQNAGRQTADYDGLLSPRCILMLGPAHSLLRPEFALLRPEALARREDLDCPKSLLITLGGIDKDNATGLVLKALVASNAALEMRITVVMGNSAPHLEAVRTLAAMMPMHTDIAVGVSDMAALMARVDLCIGAAGSTAWERCALGLPTLQVVLAENQAAAARNMADTGASIALPSPYTPEFADVLAAGLQDLSHAHAYRQMARAAAKLTDGAGASHVVRSMLERTSDNAN